MKEGEVRENNGPSVRTLYHTSVHFLGINVSHESSSQGGYRLMIGRQVLKTAPTRLRHWTASHWWWAVPFSILGLWEDLFFRGVTLNSPLSFGDLAPFPNMDAWRAAEVYQMPFPIASIPGQFIVGTGTPNPFSPLIILQGVMVGGLNSSAAGEFSFLVIAPILAALGFLLLASVLFDSRFVRVVITLLYACNPFFLIGQYAGGNPAGIYWYAIIPFVLYGVLEGAKGKMLGLCTLAVAFLSLGLIGPEWPLLTFGLFVVPTTLLLLVARRSRTMWILAGLSESLTSTLLSLYVLFAYSSSSFYTAVSSAPLGVTSLQAGFPSPGQFFSMTMPTFGLSTFFYFKSVVASSSVVAIGSTILIAIELMAFIKPRIHAGAISFKLESDITVRDCVGLALLGFGILIYAAIVSPFAPELYHLFLPMYVVDSPNKIMPLIDIGQILMVGVFLRRRIPANASSEWDSRTHMHTRCVQPGRRLIRSARRKVKGIFAPASIVAIALVLSAAFPLYSVSLQYNLVESSGQMQSFTYLPSGLLAVMNELTTAKADAGLNECRDLWLGLNAGVSLQNDIISLDKSALFYPAVENQLGSNVSASNLVGATSSFSYYRYAAESFVNSKTTSFGRLLAPLGVCMLVLLNSSFSGTTFAKQYPPYAGPPAFSQGWILGSPRAILDLVLNQTDLTVVSMSPNAWIIENRAFIGLGEQFGKVLLPFDVGLLHTNNPTVRLIANLPEATGVPLILAPGGSVPATGSIQLYDSLAHPVAEPNVNVLDANALTNQTGATMVSVPGPVGAAAEFVNQTANASLEGTPTRLAVNGRLNTSGGLVRFNQEGFVEMTSHQYAQLLSSIQDSFSVSTWFNFTGTSDKRYSLFSDGYFGTLEFNNSLYVSFYTTGNSSGIRTVPIPIHTNSWTLFVETWNATTFSIYLNGKLIQPTSTTGSIIFGSSPLSIGGFPTTTTISDWSGSIGQFTVFNSTLSPRQIASMYQSGPAIAFSHTNASLYASLNASSVFRPALTLGAFPGVASSLAILGSNLAISLGNANWSVGLTAGSNSSMGWMLVNFCAASKVISIFGSGEIQAAIVFDGLTFRDFLREFMPASTNVTGFAESHLTLKGSSRPFSAIAVSNALGWRVKGGVLIGPTLFGTLAVLGPTTPSLVTTVFFPSISTELDLLEWLVGTIITGIAFALTISALDWRRERKR